VCERERENEEKWMKLTKQPNKQTNKKINDKISNKQHQ